jgi:translocation and assembly module TamB
VQGSVNQPGFRMGRAAAEQPLVGHLRAQLSNLGFLQVVVPVLGTTTGQATADLELSGTLAAPAIAGTAHVTGAAAEVPSLGL